MGNIRKRRSAIEKRKIVIEAIKGKKTIQEITSEFAVHATQVNDWKRRAVDALLDLFSARSHKQTKEKDRLIEKLYQQIGQLTYELTWLKKKSESVDD